MLFLPVVALATSISFVPPAVAHPDTTCPHRNVPLETRKSPLDSVTFGVSGQQVKVCYGRPSARGRTMLGGADVPYGKLWRTGANEPTIFYAPVRLTVAGVKGKPGGYSVWTGAGGRGGGVSVNR